MSRTGRKIVTILGFAALGGVVGFFGARALDPIDIGVNVNVTLLLLALLFAAMGLFQLVASTNRRMTAEAMGLSVDEPDDVNPERRMLRLSGIVMLISAAAMALPALGRAPLGLDGQTAFVIVLVIIVAESFVNWRIWRESDELMRAMMGEVCTVTFWVFQLVLFVWAIGAHFGIIPSFQPLDVIALMMALYIIAAGVIGIRRGFGAR